MKRTYLAALLGVAAGFALSALPTFAAPIVMGADIVTDGGIYVVADPMVVNHSTNSATTQAIEHGADAGTAGVLSITFATAFAAVPDCSCVHMNTTNSNTCVESIYPTTTAVQFTAASGGTDRLQWICIGKR